MRLSGVVHVLHRFVFVEWCFRCLADGVFHPRGTMERHVCQTTTQNAPDLLEHAQRTAQLASKSAEFCERLGFPTWQSSYSPCFFCAVPRDSLYDATGASVFSFPHALNEDVDYQWACGRCELLVRVTQDQHRRLCLLLRYDKRQNGARG